MKLLLTIAYDGGAYSGWQRQINGLGVQEVLETALARLLPAEPGRISLTAASRTDAGVHALGQKAAFELDELKIPAENFPKALNTFLPDDIVVTRARPVPDAFNPRFDAKSKTYRYCFLDSRYPDPLLRRYTWYVPRPLDLEAMRAACPHFIGEHDFAAFSCSGSSAKTTTRAIHGLTLEKRELEREKALITMYVTGGGFLYNMVRIIAGTLVSAGLGKLGPDDIPAIIASRRRENAGKTAPPQGLTLMEVRYEEERIK